MSARLHLGDTAAMREELKRRNPFERIAGLTPIAVRPLASADGVEVPLEAVVESSPAQKRRPFDPEHYPEDQALVESLRDLGQQENVGLTEISPGQYRIVWGHRRIEALRHLKARTVRAVFKSGTQLELDTLTGIENSGQPLRPVEMAELAQYYAVVHGLPRAQIAARLGCTERHVQRLREVLRASDAVRWALNADRLTLRTARVLARASLDSQPRLAEIAADLRLTEAEAEQLVEHMEAAHASPDEAAMALGLSAPAAQPASDGNERDARLPPAKDGRQPEPAAARPGNARRKRKDSPLGADDAKALLARSVPALDKGTARRLAEEGASRGMSAAGLRLAALVAVSGKKPPPAEALDTAASLQNDPGARLVLDCLDRQTRLLDLARRGRVDPGTARCLGGLIRQMQETRLVVAKAKGGGRKDDL